MDALNPIFPLSGAFRPRDTDVNRDDPYRIVTSKTVTTMLGKMLTYLGSNIKSAAKGIANGTIDVVEATLLHDLASRIMPAALTSACVEI